MFSANKIVSGMTGTADNCESVPRSLIAAENSSKYLLNGETAFIFLKSNVEDHIFTDLAYISVKGNTSGGLKRLVTRYEFQNYPISNVMYETAGYGITDQDCELKFAIGGQGFSIDLKKKEAENGILYYKALTALANLQSREAKQLQLYKELRANVNLHVTENTVAGSKGVLDTVQTSALADSLSVLNQFNPASYHAVFAQYSFV